MKKVVAGFILLMMSAGMLVLLVGPKADCVNLYIDYGPLNNGAKIEKCITVDGEVNALEFLHNADFTTEGTQKYGEAVLCRLDGFPTKYLEKCETMPSEKSYWAVLIKEHEIIPIPFNLEGEWGWAQVGINELKLHAGDSLGLVFSDNGEVKFP